MVGADAKYFAISINVKFHGANEGDDKENQGNIDQGDEDQWTSMASLSAGQKTVVTIALIFALQRCDPVTIIYFFLKS
jgi:Chromosome segregation ATPases